MPTCEINRNQKESEDQISVFFLIAEL